MGNAAPWVICRKAGLFYFSYYRLSSVFETAQICSFLQLLPSVRIGQRAVGLTASVLYLGSTDAASSQSLLCTSIFLARDWERAGKGMSRCQNATILPSTAVFPWLQNTLHSPGLHCLIPSYWLTASHTLLGRDFGIIQGWTSFIWVAVPPWDRIFAHCSFQKCSFWLLPLVIMSITTILTIKSSQESSSCS